MSAEEDVLKIIEDQLGGVVFIAVYLFEDDAPFLVDLMLREGAVEDDVGEQFECACKVLLQEGRVHHRLLLVGEGVKVAPDILHAVEYVPGAASRGTLEQHVLHEVGQPGLVGLLVTRACINGITAIDHRRGRWGMDDAQTVGKCRRIIGTLHILNLQLLYLCC